MKKKSFIRKCYIESSLFEVMRCPLSAVPCELIDFSREPVDETARRLITTVLVDAEFLKRNEKSFVSWILEKKNVEANFVILSRTKIKKDYFPSIRPDSIYQIIPASSDVDFIKQVIEKAFENLDFRYELLNLHESLEASFDEIHRLTSVGQSLATERDFDSLIRLILSEARDLVGADGASIYVTVRKKGETPKYLRFKKSDLNLEGSEFLLPIDNNSIAGYVAMTGTPLVIDDVYALPDNVEYHFNTEFDRQHNYYSKSMLVIPMKNHREEVIGVIQLINKKRDPEKNVTLEEMKGDGVIPFTYKCMELTNALAGQAAVAIENNELIQDINNLFEGFVKASVTAIEQRDPTTSGHSFRVADFTVALAEAVDRVQSGSYSSCKFSRAQIREIRYASLLHDFGKVGVREKVLVKEKKLYDYQFDLIRWRFAYIKKNLENHYLHKKIKHLKESGNVNFQEFETLLDVEYSEKLAQLREWEQSIHVANEPNIVEQGRFEMLEEITRMYTDLDGERIPFLTNNELVSLSVRRGNLDQKERLEIESHVSHTYKFLIQIPWTGDLLHVPEIAHAHHEKLNGLGYPLGLMANEIPVQSRMMTISDIFDALTAPDRPYKKSVSSTEALDILNVEANDGRLDKELLKVFIESKVFHLHGHGF